ncbi:hypothetical protein A2T98_03365 [Nodularia spumigena CENA596]|uniref:Uncharacterized protein n=1 Tax=Nodularia spumigena CENA596 TaxID=1819295 RepID=A0A161XQE3_NODSP|nr:DUF4157 domain-containing protein [Nodularia spumigena]KZL51214.1 hypothetical protein A2T98_03365 [Nodularia spumigena CENA596]
MTNQKSQARKSTSTNTETQDNQLQGRGFTVQKKSDAHTQKTDLNTLLLQAKTFGHSISKLAGQESSSASPQTSGLSIQPKLSIGEPGDRYEQEADRVASVVVQRINAPSSTGESVQREAMPEEEDELQMKPLADSIQRLEDDEEELQMKSQADSIQRLEDDEEELQMKSQVQRQEAIGGGEASTDLESSINSARVGGQAIADNIREPMEVAFGADFSGVKVHTDGQSDQLNRSIQARAFTTGQDVFFRQGEYNPGSRGGQELLAHELTHVVQQNGGAVQRSPLSYKVTDSKTVEHVIQRYDMTYGALNNDCGTDMHVLIKGNNDPDLSKGSKPSILPSWWPAIGTTERNYFQQYVVQGHLLNQDLGGPGDRMENLTPITKSTNTTHFKHIEDKVKKEVNKGNWVEYRVQADYTTHPLLSDLGVGVPANVAPYLAYFAGEIGADYTVYDPKTFQETGGLRGVKLIKNEGKHLKGTF